MNAAILYLKFLEMKEVMNCDELLEELFSAMSNDDAEENLRWIDQMNELGIF